MKGFNVGGVVGKAVSSEIIVDSLSTNVGQTYDGNLGGVAGLVTDTASSPGMVDIRNATANGSPKVWYEDVVYSDSASPN